MSDIIEEFILNASADAKYALELSRFEASRQRMGSINIEHLILGLLKRARGKAFTLLHQFGVDLPTATTKLDKMNRLNEKCDLKLSEIKYSSSLIRILKSAMGEARMFNSKMVATEFILLAMIKDTSLETQGILHEIGVLNIHKLKIALIEEICKV